MTWPPAHTPSDQNRRVIATASREGLDCRQVNLWGRQVWLAADGRVLCDCGEFIDIDTLCRPGNGHGLSPVASLGDHVTSWVAHPDSPKTSTSVSTT